MESNQYSADQPINYIEKDLFNRASFSHRISEMISDFTEKNSMIIGINGAWGEGKTSVLNFIQEDLNTKDKIVTVKFNPWLFGNEEEMLTGFFYNLTRALDISLDTKREQWGKVFEKYVKPVSQVASSFTNIPDVGNGISSFFIKANLDELRDRVENILESADKRIVIFIDDIDRLEKNEIHSVFRLVKLTAEFKNTTYILAFDREHVASSLQEKYGTNNNKAGYNFLEKIIQIPLHLPKIDFYDLRNHCLKGIDDALSFAKIELSKEEAQLFVTNFKGLESHLKTPRQAVLFSNIINFSLPLMKKEINIVDLLLIEGLKVFTPNIYNLIRENKTIFVNKVNTLEADKKQEFERRKKVIESELNNFEHEQKQGLIYVLKYLFPRVQEIYDVYFSSMDSRTWAQEQRICSDQYFERYFTYSISKADISDQDLEKLLNLLSFNEFNDSVAFLQSIVTSSNSNLLIQKLRNKMGIMDISQKEKLIIVISKMSELFPNPTTLLSLDNPYRLSAILISELIESIDDKNSRFDLIMELITNYTSIPFSIECFYSIKKDTENHPNSNGFSKEEIREIGEKLSDIFINYLSSIKTLEKNHYSFMFSSVIAICGIYGKQEEIQQKIDEILNINSEFVITILRSYLGTSWGAGKAGLPQKSNFNESNYKSISEYVDPELITSAIFKLYEGIETPKNLPSSDQEPSDRDIAKQFLWYFKKEVS